jgi:general secretion pathway protein M
VNAPDLTLPPALAQVRQQARDYWRARAPRERRAATAAFVALAALVVWLLFVQPAWRTLSEAPAQLDSLDAQLQQLQRLGAESQSLKGAAPVTSAQAGLALKAASDRLGDKGKLTLLGDRATLTLTGVDTEALRSWLQEARSAARVRPLEAQLTRGALGYNGTIVVSLGTVGSTP